MSITTPSSLWALRSKARGAVLSVVGARAKLSDDVHVLAGHDIGPPGQSDSKAFGRLLDKLQSQADLIRIEDAVKLIQNKTKVDRPKVSFTFDDGFIDCHQHLAPTLEKFGTNAAFFVNPRYIGAEPDYIERFNRTAVRSFGRLPMTTHMVRDLDDRGFVIGCHTGDHARLDDPDPSTLTDQIVTSREEVETLTGSECKWFAWPYGTYEDISEDGLALALDTYEVVFSSARYTSYSSEAGRVLNRRHFEVFWPASHVQYFLRNPRSHAA